MWGMFIMALVAAVALLYIPGVFALRAARFPWFAAIACAPLVTVLFANGLTVLYGKLGIICTWYSVFGPCALVAIVALVISFTLNRGEAGRCLDLQVGAPGVSARFPAWLTFDGACMVAYVIVGMLVTTFIFLVPLGTPDAYVESFDNVHHLGQVRAFADSGYWSSLGNTLYLGVDASIDPFTYGGFYPSAWHVLAAAVLQMTGVYVACAMNAINAALLGVVLPLSTFAFMRVAFRTRPSVIAWGSIFSSVFASGACFFLVWGPLYANLMAQCLVPAVMLLFIAFFIDEMGKRERIALVVLFVVGLAAIVFAQPNGVFSTGVVLAPFCVKIAYDKTKKHLVMRGTVPSKAIKRALLAAVCMVAIIVLVWTAVYLAPFMRGVVDYRWVPEYSMDEAIMRVWWFSYFAGGVQYLGTALVIVGIIVSLYRREQRWIAVSFLIMTFIYVICVSTDGQLKQYLAGFWYTDSPRIAAIVAIPLVPLLAIGADALVGEIRLWARAFSKPPRTAKSGMVAAFVGAALITVCMFAPYGIDSPGLDGRWSWVGNPLVVRAWDNGHQYSAEYAKIYDAEERAFVDEALALVGPEAIVINEPNDGSAYAYGAQGMRIAYRYWRGYEPEQGEKPESALIRTRLHTIANDPSVQDAVHNLGATYVIQLDQGHAELFVTRMWTYGDGKSWTGIDRINDATPGFDVVLARDDMRLYKIAV